MADYHPRSILVTGGAGFIASHVVVNLMKTHPSYKVVVFDKLDYCGTLKNLTEVKNSPNFKFIKGDITSPDMVNYVVDSEEIDTIMHFAAQTHVDNSFGNSFVFTQNNVLGTHVLLEATRVHADRIKRFIHVSTDEVYGENKPGTSDESFTEHSSTMDPTNPYSATKASAEMLVKAYRQSYDLPIITTRGNNVYGPNQYPEKLIPKFLHLTMQGRKLPIHGSGQQKRSYLYVEDVARAFDVILHKGVIGEIYNVGTTTEMSVLQVAQDICKIRGLDPNEIIYHVGDRFFNDQRYFLAVDKLAALGWKQLVSWEQGLKNTAVWYDANPSHWSNIESALLAHPPRAGAPVEDARLPEVSAVPTKSSLGPTCSEDVDPTKGDMRVLIYGRTGWLGGLMGDICKKQGVHYAYARNRLEDRRGIEADIAEFKPTHILNAAGVTGRPNVDWCESHRRETIRANVIGVLNLADVCTELKVHLTNFATGCIFEYDDDHAWGSGIGFKEEDKPNFTGSYYSKTKAMVEDLLSAYEDVLVLRVRMPISSDLENPRSFVYKIARYAKVVNVPNSMTILDEMLPMALEMANRKLKGVYNFTNPGVVSHNEILEMYKKYYKPDFKWENFTLEEQAKILAAPRSNNELDASKLKAEFPELLSIKDSLIKNVFQKQTIQKTSH